MSSKDLIIKFYNEHSEFHFIPLKEFMVICNAPFSYVRQKFKEGEDVRLKYLGSFSLVHSRIPNILDYYRGSIERGYITEEDYLELEGNMNKQLELKRIYDEKVKMGIK